MLRCGAAAPCRLSTRPGSWSWKITSRRRWRGTGRDAPRLRERCPTSGWPGTYGRSSRMEHAGSA
eukprot:11150690-Alexandrium_andersonii.AAC.1